MLVACEDPRSGVTSFPHMTQESLGLVQFSGLCLKLIITLLRSNRKRLMRLHWVVLLQICHPSLGKHIWLNLLKSLCSM